MTVALGARAWMALSGEVGNQISCCQCVAPLPGLADGVAAGRIDLRRAAAGDHAHIGVRADDGDGVQASGIQREDCGLVLQQNDAAFFDLARHFKAGEGIDDAALAGIIDDAGGKHGAQDAMHVLVEFGLRDGSGFDGGLVTWLS